MRQKKKKKGKGLESNKWILHIKEGKRSTKRKKPDIIPSFSIPITSRRRKKPRELTRVTEGPSPRYSLLRHLSVSQGQPRHPTGCKKGASPWLWSFVPCSGSLPLTIGRLVLGRVPGELEPDGSTSHPITPVDPISIQIHPSHGSMAFRFFSFFGACCQCWSGLGAWGLVSQPAHAAWVVWRPASPPSSPYY